MIGGHVELLERRPGLGAIDITAVLEWLAEMATDAQLKELHGRVLCLPDHIRCAFGILAGLLQEYEVSRWRRVPAAPLQLRSPGSDALPSLMTIMGLDDGHNGSARL